MSSDERDDVISFFMDAVEPDRKARVFTDDLFRAYKKWRVGQELKETELSIDSFGRFIPKNFMRKNYQEDNVQARGVVGARLR